MGGGIGRGGFRGRWRIGLKPIPHDAEFEEALPFQRRAHAGFDLAEFGTFGKIDDGCYLVKELNLTHGQGFRARVPLDDRLGALELAL